MDVIKHGAGKASFGGLFLPERRQHQFSSLRAPEAAGVLQGSPDAGGILSVSARTTCGSVGQRLGQPRERDPLSVVPSDHPAPCEGPKGGQARLGRHKPPGAQGRPRGRPGRAPHWLRIVLVPRPGSCPRGVQRWPLRWGWVPAHVHLPPEEQCSRGDGRSFAKREQGWKPTAVPAATPAPPHSPGCPSFLQEGTGPGPRAAAVAVAVAVTAAVGLSRRGS